jgi:hypothetical protein
MVDGDVRYTVEGCRASGDMNTALGNVLLMCAITHHYLDSLNCKWRFINDGDDCGIFLEQDDRHLLEGLPAHHLQFGFEMEVEEAVFEIEKVEFCQSRPCQINEHEWMMVRNIHKALAHDWITITGRDWCTSDEVLHATGVCGVSLYGDLPVLGDMYHAMLRCPSRAAAVQRLLETKDGWRRNITSNRLYPVDETIARVSLYKAFDILPDQQIDLENRFRAFDPRKTLLKTPASSQSTDSIRYLLD